MSYEFHKLKTVSVGDGEVSIRIPRCWEVWPQEGREGYWGCYEEGDDAETGTLWIQIDHFSWDGPGEPPPMFSRESVERMAAEADAETGPSVESTIVPVDGGVYWLRVYDVVEDGEPLRFWNSRFFLGRGAYSAIISFNLVLTHAQMDEPEFVGLREIMDREVRAAFLDPFRIFDEREAAQALGRLRIVDFDDQVSLLLPEAMGGAPYAGEDGTTGNQWYCQLETGTSHAGMFVTMDEQQVPEDQMADALAAIDGHVADGPFGTIGRPPEDPLARRTPRGVVFYEANDDAAEPADGGADGPPLRNHVWTYLCPGEGGIRQLQVILMIPLPKLDTPPYPALVAYVDGAVRRAEFPGVG